MNDLDTLQLLCCVLQTRRDMELRRQEPLAEHCTFRIGGNAEVFIQPRSLRALELCVSQCCSFGVPFLLLGNGSNVLFSDNGFTGAVLCTKMLRSVRQKGQILIAQAGVMLPVLARHAQRASLQGLAFACGIPGTVGGALTMNAGAYGGQMSDITQSVIVWDIQNACVRTLSAEACEFGYRKSVFQTGRYIILQAQFALQLADSTEILTQMQKNLYARQQTQPLAYPSAGSIFKRGDGFASAQLIDRAGLKGLQIGGAQVSEKHAGFIINRGGATAADVTALIERIQCTVAEKYGKQLECELCRIGC